MEEKEILEDQQWIDRIKQFQITKGREMTKQDLEGCPIVVQVMTGLLKGSYKVEVIDGKVRPLTDSSAWCPDKQTARERAEYFMTQGAVLSEDMRKRLWPE